MAQSKTLPARPNLEHLKKQAKQRLRELRVSAPDATLADAQLALAREYGYGSWRALHRQVTTAPLILATSAGDLQLVKELLDAGYDIEGRDQFGNTPLGWTRGEQLIPILKFLLKRGANPNALAYNGHSPVGLYAYECEPAAVKLLLAHGADPNQPRESSGETPLHLAVVKDRSGRLDCVRMLLEAGAQPNPRTKVGAKADREGADRTTGETPLHIAAARGDAEVIRLLLQFGADPSIRDTNRMTPADIAAASGHPEFFAQSFDEIAQKAVRKMGRPWTESSAIIERKFDSVGDEPYWEFAGIESATLREREADALITRHHRKLGQYRMISIWHRFAGGKLDETFRPTRALESFSNAGGDVAARPGGGTWRRIDWLPANPGYSRGPRRFDDLAEAIGFLHERGGDAEYRIITVRRMLRAQREPNGRIKVVKKHDGLLHAPSNSPAATR